VVGETTMIREPIRYVVYLRATNGRQGKGGLGMDVQYATVVEFLRQRGGTIVAQYVEGETGNRSDRPELARALESARKDNATLLIAKLGRLARNAAFIANLMDAGVEFRASDQPFASRLTLPILAAEAEVERRRVSERTKAALQAAKGRGVKLGSPIAVETVVAARAARSRYSANANATIRSVIADIQRSGVSSLVEIGKALEARGVRTPRGHKTWRPVQVWRLLGRVAI
jgi:DNA invertase Pin-like site-specific DNA recombinase